MAPKSRDRRFPISLPLVKEIRLSLWAHTRGVSKTRMAEAILIDRVSAGCNWDEVCRDLKQEAAIRQLPVDNLIKEILMGDKFDEYVEMEGVDWGCLLDGKEPEISETTEQEE